MVTDSFFNKSRYVATRLTDQVDVAPGVSFTLPTAIYDVLTFAAPTTVTAVLQKVSGRDVTTLPTVITVTNTYKFTGTPALVDWDGKTSLQLKITVNLTNTLVIPLVIKG